MYGGVGRLLFVFLEAQRAFQSFLTVKRSMSGNKTYIVRTTLSPQAMVKISADVDNRIRALLAEYFPSQMTMKRLSVC